MAVMDKLYKESPYKELINSNQMRSSETGWGSTHPNFAKVIERTNPKLIVEVGSWLGDSAIHMASLLGFDCEIVCVDTWLGSSEMWMDHNDPTRYGRLNLVHGYPNIYYSFLWNVFVTGYHNIITPCPMTSLQAARLFTRWGIAPDVVYLDASHDYEDVLSDLQAWYPLAKDTIFGDDYNTFREVADAVQKFCLVMGIEFTVEDERQWVIRKSP